MSIFASDEFAAYRNTARDWLAAMAPTYGSAVRRGLTEQDDLALGRRYQTAKYEAGYAGINWPKAVGGQGLTNTHKVVFELEEAPFGMPNAYFVISLGMPVPMIARFGANQVWIRERTIAALRGEEIWCQLFSEPSAGSDLAALRTRAEPCDGGWRVNGQKLWTSWAQHSDYGIIVVRTDPAVPKHHGLTYFWIDMNSTGVTVRPVRLAGGTAHVNEVFFDDVWIDDQQRMGEVGRGFGVAMTTLLIERHHASDSAGFGPQLEMFVKLAEKTQLNGKPAILDGRIRSAIARNHALRGALDAITMRAMLAMQDGQEPGPEGSLNKLVSVQSRQSLSELALNLQGAAAIAYDPRALPRDDWAASWLSSPTGRIAGGADEMLLNTIAEKILGLPQDHRPEKGIPFNQTTD